MTDDPRIIRRPNAQADERALNELYELALNGFTQYLLLRYIAQSYATAGATEAEFEAAVQTMLDNFSAEFKGNITRLAKAQEGKLDTERVRVLATEALKQMTDELKPVLKLLYKSTTKPG